MQTHNHWLKHFIVYELDNVLMLSKEDTIMISSTNGYYN